MAAAVCHPWDGMGHGSSHLLVFILWSGQTELENPMEKCRMERGESEQCSFTSPLSRAGGSPGWSGGFGGITRLSPGGPSGSRASPPAPPSQHKGKVVLSPGLPSARGQKPRDT